MPHFVYSNYLFGDIKNIFKQAVGKTTLFLEEHTKQMLYQKCSQLQFLF